MPPVRLAIAPVIPPARSAATKTARSRDSASTGGDGQVDEQPALDPGPGEADGVEGDVEGPGGADHASACASTSSSSSASTVATSATPPAARIRGATASSAALPRPARKTRAPSAKACRGGPQHPRGAARRVRRGRTDAAATAGRRVAVPRLRPTEKGRELPPVIIARTHWGDRWTAPDGPPVISGTSTAAVRSTSRPPATTAVGRWPSTTSRRTPRHAPDPCALPATVGP